MGLFCRIYGPSQPTAGRVERHPMRPNRLIPAASARSHQNVPAEADGKAPHDFAGRSPDGIGIRSCFRKPRKTSCRHDPVGSICGWINDTQHVHAPALSDPVPLVIASCVYQMGPSCPLIRSFVLLTKQILAGSLTVVVPSNGRPVNCPSVLAARSVLSLSHLPFLT